MTTSFRNKLCSIVVSFLCLPAAGQAATYHDETVKFPIDDRYEVKGGSFTVESFKISKGQDPDGKVYEGLVAEMDASDNSVTFRIGRHKTKEVADWFKKRIQNNENTFDDDPKELNFALMGTLVLDLKPSGWVAAPGPFTFRDIMLAQGSKGAANNWWFGGKNCNQEKSADHRVYCWGEDANGDSVKFLFKRGGAGISNPPVNKVEVTPQTFINPNSWTHRLPDATKLNGIVLPGSHDAGMSTLSHCTGGKAIGPWVQTQDLGIHDQAEAGSRYFDLRIDYDHDELVTYHRTMVMSENVGCNGQSLNDILEEARLFVGERDTEFLILKFSHIRSDRNEQDMIMQKIDDMVMESANQAVLYKSTDPAVNLNEVPIGDLRGKLVLVFDYDDHVDPSQGKFRYHDGTSGSYNMKVYDQYSSTSELSQMMADQLQKLNRYGGLDQAYLFLLSWTLTSFTNVEVPPTIRSLAEEARAALPPALYKQITSDGGAKPNIVYLDFIEPYGLDVVLQYNFGR